MNFETLIDKLEYLYEAKLAIKKAIEDGGVIVPADCKFKDYAKYIKQLAPSSENVGDETKIDIKYRIDTGILLTDTTTRGQFTVSEKLNITIPTLNVDVDMEVV